MKLLLYCTKQPLYLVRNECDGYFYTMDKGTLNDYKNVETYNGKIVAECDYEVEEIYERVSLCDSWFNELHHTKTLKNKELLKKSCLSILEMNNYFKFPQGTCDKVGYAIHIKNLHIFDKPRGLFNYCGKSKQKCEYVLLKAPQNMMYCYGNNTGEKYVLISIRPEWICKILNGEKTIEVRRKVLKGMLNDRI